MRYNRKYIEKIMKDPLPLLLEEDRINLNAPYMARGFAKHSNCGFDGERKLWFTGINNSNLVALVKLYGVNEATSVKMKQLLEEKMTLL